MLKIAFFYALILAISFNVNAESFIDINGSKLEYEIKGKGKGKLWVLFDAGALTGMAGWDAVWKGLPNDITAIRFSRLGEGVILHHARFSEQLNSMSKKLKPYWRH